MRGIRKWCIRGPFIVVVAALFLWAGSWVAYAQSATATVTALNLLGGSWQGTALFASWALTYGAYARWFAAGIGPAGVAAICGQIVAGYVITHWSDQMYPALKKLFDKGNTRVNADGTMSVKTTGYEPKAGTQFKTDAQVMINYNRNLYGEPLVVLYNKFGNPGNIHYTWMVEHGLNWWGISNGGGTVSVAGFQNPVSMGGCILVISPNTAAGDALYLNAVDTWNDKPLGVAIPPFFGTGVNGIAAASPSQEAQDAAKELIGDLAKGLGGDPVWAPMVDTPGNSAITGKSTTPRQESTIQLQGVVPPAEWPPWTVDPPVPQPIPVPPTPPAPPRPYTDPGYTGAFNPSAWPAVPSISAQWQTFTNSVKATSMFSLPNQLTTGLVAGSPEVCFEAGVFGSHCYNFSQWPSTILNVIKGLVMVACSWVAIRVVMKGGA